MVVLALVLVLALNAIDVVALVSRGGGLVVRISFRWFADVWRILYFGGACFCYVVSWWWMRWPRVNVGLVGGFRFLLCFGVRCGVRFVGRSLRGW